MHDQLFTHQETLGNGDIEGFAKKLELDMDKFKADWVSNDTKDKVAKDKEQGSRVGITGTPSIFINGRKFMQYGHGDFQDQLKDWMRLELSLGGKGGAPSAPASVPAPAPSPAPSAKGSK
jgi:protein-disulfide isomerase